MKTATKIIKDFENFVNDFTICLLVKQQVFLTNFSLSTTNFYGVAKVGLSKIIQENVQTQKSEYIKMYKISDFLLQSIATDPNCPTCCFVT